jgi:DNA repair protein RecO (recombination protein O)
MLVVTGAIVQHAFDYLETSRILRLITRDAGVQSVLAKGARRSRGRFGSGIDLFAEGEVQMYVKPTRELHTLAGFEITRSRAGLALDMDRFAAASALVELVVRFGGGEPNPALFDSVAATLDDLALSAPEDVSAHALAGLWRMIGASGFTPALDSCASCHAALEHDARVVFSHAAGGALCARCARLAPMSRSLPADARLTIREWLAGTPPRPLSGVETRAHQRLLREFVGEHLSDDRPLRAFAAWEMSQFGEMRRFGV